MTDGYVGFTTTLTWNGVPVAEITSDIPFPEITREDIDFYNHDSPDQFGEWKPGKADGGEVQIECNFIPGDSAQAAAISDLMSGTTREVVIADSVAGFSWTFDAYCKGVTGGSPLNDRIGLTLTFKVTGRPVLGVTTATGPTALVVTGNVSGGLSMVPTYSASEYSYIINGSSDANVTVTVTASGADSITVNGNTVDSGVPSSAIDLTPGEITEIAVVVGETGKASLTYTLRVSGASA